MDSNPFDPKNPNFQYLVSMMSSRERSDTHALGGCLALALLVAALFAVGLLLAH